MSQPTTNLTPEQAIDEIKKVVAAHQPAMGAPAAGIDFDLIRKILPFLAVIPGLAPFIPIIEAALPVIEQLLKILGVSQAAALIAALAPPVANFLASVDMSQANAET